MRETRDTAIKQNERRSEFELLRIISMCMIISMHYMTKGMKIEKLSVDAGLHNVTFWIIYGLCLSSVNAYVFISGYFAKDTKWNLGKLIRLWAQVMVYSICVPLVGRTEDELFSHAEAILAEAERLEATYPGRKLDVIEFRADYYDDVADREKLTSLMNRLRNVFPGRLLLFTYRSEEEGGESESVSGSMGINAAKLARMLAAAKTRSQVQAVMDMIQSDLRECDVGKEQGLDVDEASVQAAESLLEEAKSRMSSAEDREPTPQEEMMSALASLM